MCLRRMGLGLLAALTLALGNGCKKSAVETPAGDQKESAASKKPVAETIARIHWLGKKRLASEANATNFMSIWNLPESAALQVEFLDKVARALGDTSEVQRLKAKGQSQDVPSTNQVQGPKAKVQSQDPIPTNLAPAGNQPRGVAPAHAVAGAAGQSNQSSSLGQLRSTNQLSTLNSQLSTTSHSPLFSMLEDLVQEECYLEVQRSGNEPADLALAIRLNNDRASFWETNLPSATKLSTFNFQPSTTNRSRPLSVKRVGEWTLVGATNALVAELADRIQRDQKPFSGLATNLWLEADPANGQPRRVPGIPEAESWLEAELDLGRLAPDLANRWKLPFELPKVSLAVIGDGQNVRTRAWLDFPKPLPFEFEPWNIPTNLISQPLSSFMAIGGIRPWLASLPAWKDLQIGSPPNQFYAWSLPATAPMTYFGWPQPDASNQVARIADLALEKINPPLAKDDSGKFLRATNFYGIFWTGFPAISPFVQSTDSSAGGFVFGGVFPPAPTESPLPLELLGQILPQKNLVWYEWEQTGQRLVQWLVIGQTIRFLCKQAQLPNQCSPTSWINAANPKLVTCLTGLNQTGPNQLLFVRRSSVGFSSIELHLLADWLESPTFPRGLHTFVAPPMEVPQ